MSTLLKENKSLIRFLSICLLGYIAWFLIYTLWLEPGHRVDFWLSTIEAKEITFILKSIGFNIEHVLEYTYKYLFFIDGKRNIGLAHSCNGLVLFPLFSLFIIATPGQWKSKLYYILIGCFAIYHVNILRIISLIFVKLYYPSSLAFNHKYTFTILVYSFIFFLWHLWIKKYSHSDPTRHEE
jgi:exosortase family protein XrtF